MQQRSDDQRKVKQRKKSIAFARRKNQFKRQTLFDDTEELKLELYVSFNEEENKYLEKTKCGQTSIAEQKIRELSARYDEKKTLFDDEEAEGNFLNVKHSHICSKIF